MSDSEDETVLVRRSSRRRESKRGQEKNSALEKLKEARRSGKAYKPADNTISNVYDEVDDDEYNKIIAQRQESDFVVDDDGAGYVDHGEDFEEEQEEGGTRGKRKKERKEKQPKKGSLANFFAVAPKQAAKSDKDVKLEDDDALADLLNEVAEDPDENQPIRANPFKRNRSPDEFAPHPIKKTRVSSTIRTPASSSKPTVSSTVPRDADKRPPPARVVVASPKKEAMNDSFDDDDVPMDTGFDHEDVAVESPVIERKTAETKREEKATKREEEGEVESKAEPMESMPEATTSEPWADETNESESPQPSVELVPGTEPFYRTVEGRQCIRFYWLDAFEDDRKHPGTVYLFGRVQLAGNQSGSVCIVVRNIKRQIFLLPKTQESGEPYPLVEVYNEIKSILLNKFRVNEVRCKQAKRRFVKDGTVDSDEEVAVMEVQYESRFARLPPDTEGTTFSRILNTTTTAMERLLVECRVKGPGWIDAFSCVPSESKVSFCQYEFILDMATDLKGGTDTPKTLVYDPNCQMPPPAIRMMCFNAVVALNEKKESEIVALSYLLNPRASLTDPTTDTRNFRRHCFVTGAPKAAIPFDMQKRLVALRMDKNVQCMKDEKALLVSFLNTLAKEDVEPDCFVGHDLAATVSLLMARFEKHKIPIWSRLSRLRRSVDIKKLGHGKFVQWEITAGRLMLDSRAAAMELVHSRTFDLTELVATLLKGKREEVYPHEVPLKYSDAFHLAKLLNWSWTECHLSLRLLVQIQALPLFTRITNICGGVMSRTLLGGRSERNEFLLLHAFERAGYIAPDKYQFTSRKGGDKKGGATQSAGAEGGGEEETKHQSKGAQYSGGLVLEPKKGLYDTLILLLDFNSLYPSIIQQYNICFTTIKHDKNGDDLPDPPTDADKGILPAQIEALVSQRYEVKKLMANERNAERKKQYDIRQKALKLTANSMYGCLGFAQSRFYAKPLAALVTAKGREILMETKDLVERQGYEVVYGDTDSIMVNTGDVDEDRAKRVARDVTKSVNSLRDKLELEHEGTFRRMLLLKKKKYAALVMDGGKGKKELKGLDIVRRDWSTLAKDIGNDVVDIILNPSLSREDLVSRIEEILCSLKKSLEEGTVPEDKFTILKSLTKDPSAYTDVKQQPHAAVAKRMNESGRTHYKQGDVVEYIICEEGSSNGPMQRAYHRLELLADSDTLKIDRQYYLAHQVHPVVSRLCAPIEELDCARIAEIIGLDATQYRRAAAAALAAEEASAAEWAESFEHCDALRVTCTECGHVNEIREMFRGEGMDRQPSLEACSECRGLFFRHEAAILNQFRRQHLALIEREQMAPFACDDVVCGYTTRSFPMTISRDGIECPKCRGGIMQKQYTSKHLFEQQTFFCRLLDISFGTKKIRNTEQRTTIEHRPNHKDVTELCTKLLDDVREMMKRNAYNIVDLSFLFAPMVTI